MFVYTVTQTHTPVGELAVGNVPCPHCQKEQLRMQFSNLREDSFFHAATHMPAIPLVTCSACHTEIERNDFNQPLTEFYRQHQKAYRGKFRFWFKWKFVAFVAVVILGLGLSQFKFTMDADASNDRAALVKQHLGHPIVGDIFEAWVTTQSDNPREAPKIAQRWFKLVRIEGDVLIMQQDIREYNLMKNKPEQNVDVKGDSFAPTELRFQLKDENFTALDSRDTMSIWRVTPAG